MVRIVQKTYMWVKAGRKLLKFFELTSQIHIGMLAIEKDAKDGLGGTGIVNHLA